MRVVARLKAGDRVAVVAPSGPVPRERFETGAAILRARYQLAYDDRIFAHTGFLAGDDDARTKELQAALDDDSARAVFCARGGYGLGRIVGRLDLRRVEKPVIGFSDTTALHGALQQAGLRSVHGPVVTQLGDLPTDDADALFALLETDRPAPPVVGLRPLGSSGRAGGRLVGGNLEVLSRLVGTSHFPSLADAVLLLEDVGERPYRMDRALTQLANAGALHGLRGCVVGDLVGCVEKDGSGPTAEDVIAERLAHLKIPVAAGLPIGHGKRNRPVVLGGYVVLEHDTLTFVDSLVA